MKTRVICLPPGQLQPGMIVATPVTGPQGAILLAAGAALESHSLDQLRRRGIGFVCVSLPDSRDGNTIAHDTAKAAARVDFIFRGEGSSTRNKLHRIILDYRREQAA